MKTVILVLLTLTAASLHVDAEPTCQEYAEGVGRCQDHASGGDQDACGTTSYDHESESLTAGPLHVERARLIDERSASGDCSEDPMMCRNQADTFEFESSIEELDAYVAGRGRVSQTSCTDMDTAECGVWLQIEGHNMDQQQARVDRLPCGP